MSNTINREPNMSFYLVSDCHVSSPEDERGQIFRKTLQDMKNLGIGTGFVNAGDNTPNGTREQQDSFWSIFAENLPVKAENVVMALGNHDVRGAHEDWTTESSGPTPFFDTLAKPYYLKDNQPYMPDTQGKVYFEKWIGSYHFTVLNTEKGLKDTIFMTEQQLDWLEQTLKGNARDDRPNFLVVHQALEDTHWRSNILSSFGENDQQVKMILQKYPQTIVLSGHIHNGLGVAEVLDREFGTLVEVPSLNESENGVIEAGTGYVVSLYDDCIWLRARNFAKSQWLPSYDSVVQFPTLPVAYQKAKEGGKRALLAKAERRLSFAYDQSVITAWDDSRPPAEPLFSLAYRKENEGLAVSLLLTEVDE